MDRLNPRNRASFAYTPAVMEDNELVFTSGLDEELEDGTGAGWDDLSLVANEREVCFYNTIKEDVKLDQRYYTPNRSTNPLFDAFSFDIISRGGRRLITINLFQMTTAQSHGGSAKGYDDVASLRSKVERRVAMEEWESCEIRIRYILVVPSTPKRRVVWHLPGGWSNSKVKGPVYVLLIPVRTHEA
ncbi:hypothetical protein AX16_004640 [Volvariella volvacea WC 439]|nr:hypothetical protein AX16_004640 [Volvariella volvacea WC 439]